MTEGGADAASLRRWVETLAGDIGERNVFRPHALGQAADVIAQAWRAQRYDVTSQVYEVDRLPCANLEVTRRGTVWPDRIVLVGAHYDSVVGSPGADDNASGVAALLALSRRFAVTAPASTVRFVAFVNEEPPFFLTEAMGSVVYAARARARGDRIHAMLSLETIGYHTTEPGTQRYPPLVRPRRRHRGDFIAFVSNLASRRLLRRAVELFRAHSDFPVERLAAPALVPGVSWSDHGAFWREGYRALMVTDTAPYRYPHYHTRADTPDRLDYVALARIVDGLTATVGGLAAGE